MCMRVKSSRTAHDHEFVFCISKRGGLSPVFSISLRDPSPSVPATVGYSARGSAKHKCELARRGYASAAQIWTTELRLPPGSFGENVSCCGTFWCLAGFKAGGAPPACVHCDDRG